MRTPGRTVWSKVPFCTPTGGHFRILRASVRLDVAKTASSELRATRGRTSLGILLGLALTILIAAAWLPGALSTRSTASFHGPTPATTAFEGVNDDSSSNAEGEVAIVEGSSAAAGGSRSEVPDTTARAQLLLSLHDDRGALYEGEWRVRWTRSIRHGSQRPDGVLQGTGSSVRILVGEPGPYSVTVSASGAASADGVATRLVGTEVVAARLDPDDPPVPIFLQRTPLLSGSVVDEQGEALEGIMVWFHPGGDLFSTRPAPVRTDAAGRFSFNLESSGRGQILVGEASHPWVPSIAIEAHGRDVHLDPIRVELFAATFLVVDFDGNAVGQARLEGTGLEGGHFLTKTDMEGRAHVEQMPRGRWRVLAQHADHGRANRAAEIPLAKDEPVVLILPR